MRATATQRPTYACAAYDYLDRDTESSLSQLIMREINFNRKLNILRDRLAVLSDFTPLSAFKAIDDYNDGHLDHFNLKRFLRKNGHLATDEELIAIIRRIDTNADSKLSYNEFAEFVRTHVPLRSASSYQLPERESFKESLHESLRAASREASPVRRVERRSSERKRSEPLKASLRSTERLPKYTSPLKSNKTVHFADEIDDPVGRTGRSFYSPHEPNRLEMRNSRSPLNRRSPSAEGRHMKSTDSLPMRTSLSPYKSLSTMPTSLKKKSAAKSLKKASVRGPEFRTNDFSPSARKCYACSPLRSRDLDLSASSPSRHTPLKSSAAKSPRATSGSTRRSASKRSASKGHKHSGGRTVSFSRRGLQGRELEELAETLKEQIYLER